MPLKTSLASILAALLAGCGATNPPIPPTKTVYKVVEIPMPLLAVVKPTPPPERQGFIDASDQKRVLLLWENNAAVRLDLEICNKQLYEVGAAQSKAQAAVIELNKKEPQ